MKTATGLTVIALGAVFAFAVHGHPWFLNLQVCGYIIMVLGVAGLILSRGGLGWARRQVGTRRGPDARPPAAAQDKRYPTYIMIDPAAAQSAGEGEGMPEMPTDTETKSWASSETLLEENKKARGHAAQAAEPDEESVEEYFQE